MKMLSVFAAFIVCHGLLLVQSNNDIGTKVITGKLHNNFLNLFDSIHKNDLDKTDAFRNFLEQEAVKEQQAFDTVKEQLQSARQRNTYNQRNLDQKGRFTGGKVFKRDSHRPLEVGPELEENDDSSLPDTSDMKANFYNITAENAFKKLYPNLDELEPWPMAENLTVDFLRHICINILMDVCPSHVPTVRLMKDYRDPEPGQLQATRVMRRMPVEFQEGIKYMTLIRCVSKDFEFHVARGDDEYVFKIQKDPKSDSYFFFSGPHAINFKDELR